MKKVLFLLCLTLIIGNAFALTDADLNSWWKFDTNTAEVTPDYKGYNNGTAFGALNLPGGLFGKDYNFQNDSDHIDLNGASWQPASNFSINVWVKTSKSNGNRIIGNFRFGAPTQGWLIDCGGSGNSARFGVGDGIDFVFASDTNALNSCDTNTPTRWVMISGTYDGNSIKLYFNGQFVKDATQTPSVSYSGDYFSVGALRAAGNYAQSMTGQIDEVSVYNKVLTDANILELYNGGIGITPPLITPITVDANYSWSIDKTNAKVILINTSGLTGSVKIDFNTWKLNDTNIGYTRDFNYTVTELTDYNIGLRTDTNTGISDTQYYKFNTGDWAPPVTTIDYNFPNNDTNALIQIYCTDNNSGCASTTYRIDGGAWNNYTNTFSFIGTGIHTIDYNSTDVAGNKEATNTSDLNMPILITVLFPKDQDTGLDIDHNWRLDISGASTQSYSDLNSDKNIYLPSRNTSILRVVDMDSNYRPSYYAINSSTDQNVQPYLLLVDSATNVLTKITTLKQTSLGLTTYPGVTVKIYKNISTSGLSLIEQLQTDGKGQTSAYLTAGETYYFNLYDGNTLLVFNQISTIPINVITTTVTFTVSVTGDLPPNPTSKGVFIEWVPLDNSTPYLPSGTTWDINQYLWNKSGQIYTATLHAYKNGVELVIPGTLPKTTTTAANSIFYNNIPWASLTKGQIVFVMDINQADGNTYAYSQTYTLFQNDTNLSSGYTFDILNGLRVGLRQDLGYNATEVCPPLLGLALLIIFGSLGILTIKVGSFGGQGTVGMALAGMALFTYLNWIPLELTAIAFIVGGAFIINDSNLR